MDEYRIRGHQRVITLIAEALREADGDGWQCLLECPECEPTDWGYTGEAGGMWFEYGKKRYYFAITGTVAAKHERE